MPEDQGVDTRCAQWETYNRRNELKHKVETLNAPTYPESLTLNVSRREATECSLNDKLDTLTDLMERITKDHEEERETFHKEIKELKDTLHTLKNERRTSTLDNEDVTVVKDYVTRQIDEHVRR